MNKEHLSFQRIRAHLDFLFPLSKKNSVLEFIQVQVLVLGYINSSLVFSIPISLVLSSLLYIFSIHLEINKQFVILLSKDNGSSKRSSTTFLLPVRKRTSLR